jgi:putative oxidoreductase
MDELLKEFGLSISVLLSMTLLFFLSTENMSFARSGSRLLRDSIYGFLLAGIGLLVGGITSMFGISKIKFVAELSDLITRFSGITMCCITTGVIWVVTKPNSLWDVVLHDNFHLFLWAGGLYFALRGNWAVAVTKR